MVRPCFWLTARTWRPARLSSASVEPVFAARMTAAERRRRRQNLALLCAHTIQHRRMSEDCTPVTTPVRKRSHSLQVTPHPLLMSRRASSDSALEQICRKSSIPVDPKLKPRPFIQRLRCALHSFFHRFHSGHQPLPLALHDTSDVSIQADELSIMASPGKRHNDKDQILVRIKHVGVPVLPPSWEIFSPTKCPTEMEPPPDLVNPSLMMEKKRVMSGYEKRRVSFSDPLTTVYHVECPPFQTCEPGETCVPKVENRPMILFL